MYCAWRSLFPVLEISLGLTPLSIFRNTLTTQSCTLWLQVTECPPEPEPECYKDADCMVEGGSTPDKCQTCVMGKCMDKCPGGFCNADKGNKCEAITKPECESVAAGGVWNTATGTCECFCSKWTSAAKKCTGIRAHPFKTEFCSAKFSPGAAVVDPDQWYAAYGPGYIGKCTAPGRCQVSGCCCRLVGTQSELCAMPLAQTMSLGI
jgi:hypothetical protein